MLPLTFFDLNDPAMFWSLNLLLPKASASAFYYYQICKKMLRNLKYWPSYFYIVLSLYLNLHCSNCFLLLYGTKLEIFVNICPVSLPHLHLKICKKNSCEERTFDHLHLLLAYYIFLRQILQIESIVLLYFSILSKSNKSQLSSSLKSNVWMFCYHVVKMNEV